MRDVNIESSMGLWKKLTFQTYAWKMVIDKNNKVQCIYLNQHNITYVIYNKEYSLYIYIKECSLWLKESK